MKRIIDIDEEEYNRIRHFCSLTDINIPLGWFEIAKSKPLQEELEEIAKEFTEQNIQVMVWGNGVVPLVDLRDCVKILDKRIAELKGENK